jgi:glycosyltransferase involved in cell wall biosynthesis
MAEVAMINVFVNGLSAKSGGGLSILTNFLKVASNSGDSYRYIVAVSDEEQFAEFANGKIKLVSLNGLSHTILVPVACCLVLPLIAYREKCQLIFNLGDIPIISHLPQVFLFDWPYAAFLESPAWHLGSLREIVIRKMKLNIFKACLPFVDVMIAQNSVLRDCIRQLYCVQDIHVVPNAVSLDNLSEIESRDFDLGNEFKLLCLSRYYSHKNIEIFIPIAERIKDANLPIKIVTTISPYDGDGAVSFIDEIKSKGLSNVIINLGTVSMEHVPSLYRQTDALLLPSLLESFSGTYVEAMFHNKVILTSDLPFATGVCGDGALYFDPENDTEIFTKICEVVRNSDLRSKTIEKAKCRIGNMLTWDQAYLAYGEVFSLAMQKKRND